jgi:biopolymer transport protein ExbB/TolQ
MLVENMMTLLLLLVVVILGVDIIGVVILIEKVNRLQKFIKSENDVILLGEAILHKIASEEKKEKNKGADEELVEKVLDDFYRG